MPSFWALVRDALSIFARYPLQFAALASITVALGILAPRSFWLLELWTVVVFVISTIAGAILVLAAASVNAGAGPRIPNSVHTTFRRLRDVFEFTLRHFGAVLLLAITIIGIPWAIRILVRWTFGTQAVMLNDLTAKEAITKSCRLVDGRWWAIALLLLMFLALSLPIWVADFAWRGSAAVIAIRIAYGLAMGPVWAIFWTLLFLRLQESAAVPPDESLPAPNAP